MKNYWIHEETGHVWATKPASGDHICFFMADDVDAAIAAKDAEIKRLRNAVLWALGEVGEFPANPASPDAKGIQRRPYYWRTELRTRAFGELNSGGTPE